MVVTTSKIKGKRAGRPDYTIAIEASSIPMVRSHQLRVTTALDVSGIYLPPGAFGFVGGTVTEDYVGKSLMEYNASVDVGRNVLLEGFFGFLDSRTYGTIPGTDSYGPQFGYGKLEWRFSKGIPVVVPHKWLLGAIIFRQLSETYGPFTLSYRFMGIRDKYPEVGT